MPKELLKTNIDAAILALAPAFGIPPKMTATFRQPTYVVCDEIILSGENTGFLGAYYWNDARFEFPCCSISNFKTLGHEVGHYLHHELNPNVREQMKKKGINSSGFWWGEELTELVAEYAGIIYSTFKDMPFSPTPASFHSDSRIPGIFSQLLDVASDRGYKRAEKAFQQYGETLLSELARMNLDDAMNVLPKLLPVTFTEKRILPVLYRLKIF